MGFLDGFNANDYEESQDFTPIQEGEYIAVIVESEQKENSKGTGEFLKLKFEIAAGEYKGRTLFANLNIKHRNETAQSIARRELADICRAFNVLQPKDSVDLHGLPLSIKVVCRQNDKGEMSNDIKKFASKDAARPAAKEKSNKDRPW